MWSGLVGRLISRFVNCLCLTAAFETLGSNSASGELGQRGLTRESSSLFKPTLYQCSFSPATPTPRGCTQLPLARYRLYCILRDGRGNERQLHCLRFLRSSRQVDCARKNGQLYDRTYKIFGRGKVLPLNSLHRVATCCSFSGWSRPTVGLRAIRTKKAKWHSLRLASLGREVYFDKRKNRFMDVRGG